MGSRSAIKAQLARAAGGAPARGATLLIFHRVGGGTGDELDTPLDRFEAELDALVAGGHDVVHLDEALDRLAAGDDRPSVVLTFDDGFADVHAHALPLLVERRLPFTLYVAAGLLGGTMAWEGSNGHSQGAPALTWDQLEAVQASGLATVGNHTWDHSRPEATDEAQLDRCSDALEARLGARPRHFAWTWGIEVPALRPAIEARFRSACTGTLGRNVPGDDPLSLRRVPVRASDPLPFFEAKLRGNLVPERAYAGIVATAKGAGRLLERRRRPVP